MDKENFAFGKNNFIGCAIAILAIIIGFVLMTGPATTIENGFEPDIFSTRRIIVAPMICFFGFLGMIVAILLPKEKTTKDSINNKINLNK